jgi:hypothetical protein
MAASNINKKSTIKVTMEVMTSLNFNSLRICIYIHPAMIRPELDLDPQRLFIEIDYHRG